jgi:hypothetical protein
LLDDTRELAQQERDKATYEAGLILADARREAGALIARTKRSLGRLDERFKGFGTALDDLKSLLDEEQATPPPE